MFCRVGNPWCSIFRYLKSEEENILRGCILQHWFVSVRHKNILVDTDLLKSGNMYMSSFSDKQCASCVAYLNYNPAYVPQYDILNMSHTLGTSSGTRRIIRHGYLALMKGTLLPCIVYYISATKPTKSIPSLFNMIVMLWLALFLIVVHVLCLLTRQHPWNWQLTIERPLSSKGKYFNYPCNLGVDRW